MTILRRYRSPLVIDGQDLTIDEDALGTNLDLPGLSSSIATNAAAIAAIQSQLASGVCGFTFSKSYALTGGSHIYNNDAAFTRTGFGAGNAITSDRLGDGTIVPYFYAVATDKIATNGLELRASTNRLRLTPVSTITSTGVLDTSAPAIALILPQSEIISVEFTLCMANFATKERVRAGFLATKLGNGASPSVWAQVNWNAGSSSSVTEQADINEDTAATSSSPLTTGYISTNVCTRHYKLTSDPTGAALYGSAAGSIATPSTLLRGLCLSPQVLSQPLVFYLSTGVSTGTFTSGYYAEIGDLSINGTRVFF